MLHDCQTDLLRAFALTHTLMNRSRQQGKPAERLRMRRPHEASAVQDSHHSAEEVGVHRPQRRRPEAAAVHHLCIRKRGG